MVVHSVLLDSLILHQAALHSGVTLQLLHTKAVTDLSDNSARRRWDKRYHGTSENLYSGEESLKYYGQNSVGNMPNLGKLSTRSNLCLFPANYCTLYLVKYKCIFQELPVIGADLAGSWSLLWFHECILSKSQVFTSIALAVTSQFFALKTDLQLVLALKQPNKSDMFRSCY